MFEKNLLTSFKMMLDHAKGDRKISSEVTVLGYSRKSKDIIAPSYEDAVSNTYADDNRVHPMKNALSASTETPRNCPPLSKVREIRTEMTPDILTKILKSTAKAKHIDPTRELFLHGSAANSSATNISSVTSENIKQLKSSCPSMKTLQLHNLNLRAKQKSRRIRLVDFPSNIERISLRGSTFEPKSFFSKMHGRDLSTRLDKLQVLDIGRAVFLEKTRVDSRQCSAPERSWPVINSLEELYLEGAPYIGSTHFLESLLKNFPNLKVLDLEGTEASDADLLTIARYAPNLQELYLGYTSLKDSSIAALESSWLLSGVSTKCLPKLEVICLCDTAVTEHGLAGLVRLCQSLRSITVKRSNVSENAANHLKQVLPGLFIHRVENTHIYAVFRNQGCAHFSLKHDYVAATIPNSKCRFDN